MVNNCDGYYDDNDVMMMMMMMMIIVRNFLILSTENLGEQSDTSRESESECKPEAKSRVWWTGWLAFQAKIERVVQNKFFESFILIIIFISSACLVSETLIVKYLFDCLVFYFLWIHFPPRHLKMCVYAMTKTFRTFCTV